ncbi:hypothetical protein T12_6728, partial [Trichinella patagoniensis]
TYKLKRARKQKYWRCSKDKEGCGGAVWTDLEVPAGIDRKDHVETCRDKESCGGAVWTDLEVPAGIDRKDHVENCRVDEHMAYID